MSYITLKVQVPSDWEEILQAEMADIGFDAFMTVDGGFEATIGKEAYQAKAFTDIIEQYKLKEQVVYEVEEVAKQNWNKLWESNFPPMSIGDQCYIRASFHEPAPQFPYELIITPKMSFGTGHHATTSQMIQHQLSVDHEGKAVFDIGSGTGILGIMALKLGAASVEACDIEDWSVENALENAAANQVTMTAYVGTADQALPKTYDILLANINRNVILKDIGIYGQLAKPNAWLLLSGFRREDVDLVEAGAVKAGFVRSKMTQEGEWMSIVYQKE